MRFTCHCATHLSTVPSDRPVAPDFIRAIHRRLVTGCDDHHCPPGVLRGRDHNVTFGIPRHRGVEGGPECDAAFSGLLHAFQTEFCDLDPPLQALALHYHLAAMHPFLDDNGRTARAAEAMVLQRAGLTDRTFIAMSNFYYDEKPEYLRVLSETRAGGHDLTAYFLFGLRGIRRQCEALTAEIRRQMQRVLFRDTMYSLFNRLRTKRKRVIGEQQIEILKVLLEKETMHSFDLYRRTEQHYAKIKDGVGAYFRDVTQLEALSAIFARWNPPGIDQEPVSINLNWPEEIDESEFLKRMKTMLNGKTFKFLS